MSLKRIAVAGATGAVGTEMLKVLEQRNFPVGSIKLLASSRSIGKKLKFKGEEIPCEELKHDSFKDIDIALFSAGGGRSKEFAPSAVKDAAVVIDNSSAYRMDDKCPLIVPEINPKDVEWHNGIIANPNCSTIIMLLGILPILNLTPIKRVVCSTYQAASGAGAKAMEELKLQAEAFLAGKPVVKEAFPHQIAFNLFSHNSTVAENGYCEEENKMIKETAKILHNDEIKVTATCIRVPVFRAHSESINVECEKEISIEAIREEVKKTAGCKLVDDRAGNYFPMPLEASEQDDVLIGRIRKDPSKPNCIDIFVSGDQLLKGAALNAVQIAELL